MKDGCIHSRFFDPTGRGNYGGAYYTCQLRLNTINDPAISCNGGAAMKSKCPEWGPTVIAESYFLKKSKTDKIKKA